MKNKKLMVLLLISSITTGSIIFPNYVMVTFYNYGTTDEKFLNYIKKIHKRFAGSDDSD
ncbi:MAG: hypothetical protein ACFE9R_07425 [Candidatus Hermodarchaeota archaeon]